MGGALRLRRGGPARQEGTGQRHGRHYGYDAAGQLLTLTNRLADGTAISWFNYAYDTRGRRTAMATHYGAWAYDYDDLGQLTRAVLNSTDPQIPSQDLAYVYDALGNRIRTIENGVTTEYTANSLNQYVRVGQTNHVFDLDGNLIQEITPQGTNTFVYNDENRLIAVSQGADTWEYLYDALGNRVATTENGVAKRFVIDPIGLGNVVGQYDALGNLLAHYDHGLGLLSRTDAGAIRPTTPSTPLATCSNSSPPLAPSPMRMPTRRLAR